MSGDGDDGETRMKNDFGLLIVHPLAAAASRWAGDGEDTTIPLLHRNPVAPLPPGRTKLGKITLPVL